MEIVPNEPTRPIILRTPGRRLVLLLSVGIFFAACGLWMMSRGEFWWGLDCTTVFGAASIGLIAQLRSDRVYSLWIDSTGFTHYNLFGRWRHIAWGDVASFGITRITTAASARKFIAWKYSSGAKRPASGVFMDMRLLGFDAGCPALGLSVEDLLKLLNDFHSRYSKSSGTNSAALG
jgi:hypothetical protein